MTRDDLKKEIESTVLLVPQYRDRLHKIIDALDEPISSLHAEALIKSISKLAHSKNPEKHIKGLENLLLFKGGRFVFKHSVWIAVLVMLIIEGYHFWNEGFSWMRLSFGLIGAIAVGIYLKKKMDLKEVQHSDSKTNG